ncbi:hypothetical protein LTR84_005006 [Exophiala bonariae]|uniref:Ubiquitin-like domain-containing protein n=1 Tax=Exophiala bonariae TaxID=1690606 RepID=A0AAV9NS80_9EURO|nr:hypothetical protein LTR84_005006 [Exophiala bonariae]
MSLKPPATHGDDEYDFELTIRFSASLPDLLLSIPGSLHANTATLKQLIRSRIPDEYATRRIRLIYAGKALIDGVPLDISLKRNVSRPPSRIGTPGPYEESSGAGGRSGGGRDAGLRAKLLGGETSAPSRIYIHCSIGDLALSKEELAEEVAAAQNGAEGEEKQDDTSSRQKQQQQQTTTTPAPRGFDRLQNAGFTPTEIQSLRLQFLAIQAHTHTPDTMPSPNTLRNMEDRWLDNSTDEGGVLGAGAALDGSSDEEAQAGNLDDMIWGTVMGFFWPIGCLMWGIREEGIWSQRRKMAIVIGFILNIGLGVIRYTG